MKIFLDDKRPTPEGFTRCYTVTAAWELICQGKVSHVSFDHDLGCMLGCDGECDHNLQPTGYDLARQIEEAAFNGTIPRMTYAIHSSNPVGRKNIQAAMDNAVRYWDKS